MFIDLRPGQYLIGNFSEILWPGFVQVGYFGLPVCGYLFPFISVVVMILKNDRFLFLFHFVLFFYSFGLE